MRKQGIYYLIIVCEILAAMFCWAGSIKLFLNVREIDVIYNETKKTAFIGLFFGFLLYMVGFLIIGGEWFDMWQSTTWNGQMKAGLFLSLILFVMLFLKD